MLSKSIKVILCLPLLAASCTPDVQNSIERDKPTYQASVVKDKRFEPDAFLASKIKAEIRQTTVQDDLMKLNVLLMNDDVWDGDVDYKFEWLDDQGMIVESPTAAWNTQHFGPKETVTLVSIAPSSRCKDFRLKMQRTQRG